MVAGKEHLVAGAGGRLGALHLHMGSRERHQEVGLGSDASRPGLSDSLPPEKLLQPFQTVT